MSNQIIREVPDEETIQCFLFSSVDSNDLTWEELCKQVNDTITTLSKDYIWHRDKFNVFIPISDKLDTNVPSHLQSVTCFADNIEDEWFIVYIVFELSKLYQNLIIHIKDNDGDFLLIEAADHLQAWANPDNTDNRVFIYRGHIHVISPEIAPLEPNLELKEALRIINELPDSTQASSDIEHTILNRIRKYPDKLLENNHKTVVQLPSSIAALLAIKPSLIAPIVNAYCNHDVIDTRSCRNIEFNDCVSVEVTFTKFLYAMLLHSPLINSVKHYESKGDKKCILGVKITCGYQMIMNKYSTDLFTSKQYYKYMESLKQNGYFQNNLEGSTEYNHLLKNAKEYFSTVECPLSSNISHCISQLMLSSEYRKTKDSIKDKCVKPGYTADSEDWLTVHPDELNQFLLTRYGKTTKLKSNDEISSRTLTKELSSFLKQTSDYEGIEPNDKEKIEDDTIEFESDQFVSCIEKMLNILRTGSNENDESEESDDGYDNFESNDDSDDCDMELKAKLQPDQRENLHQKKTILSNIIQSVKEEKASTGPTSNLLSTLGVPKSELLDSDDDVD